MTGPPIVVQSFEVGFGGGGVADVYRTVSLH